MRVSAAAQTKPIGAKMRTTILLVLLFASGAALSADNSSGKPGPIVRDFYAELAKVRTGLRQELKHLSPFLTSHLNELTDRAFVANESYRKRFPTEAPPFEHGSCEFYGGGDCHFSSYKVLKTDKRGATMRTTVELTLIDTNRPGEPPHVWRDTVILKMELGRWAIDDIENPNGKASETLKRIARDASSPTSN